MKSRVIRDLTLNSYRAFRTVDDIIDRTDIRNISFKKYDELIVTRDYYFKKYLFFKALEKAVYLYDQKINERKESDY